MSKFRHGGLLAGHIGDVSSAQIGRHTIRRETAKVDGTKFFRFTLNHGTTSEFGTFWSEDETQLLRAVYRRVGIPFA